MITNDTNKSKINFEISIKLKEKIKLESTRKIQVSKNKIHIESSKRG
jgi:hypothetical protein